MLEDWQQTEHGKQIVQWVVEIQSHLRQLRDLPLSPDHQEHLRHLQEAAAALVLLVIPGLSALPIGGASSPAPAEPKATEQAPLPTDDEAPRLHPLNILLVEDNPFTQKLMTRLLTLRQHRVTLACHGQEALALIEATQTRKNRFDLVLMDLRMPVMDGLEAATAIRQWEKRQRGDSLESRPCPEMGAAAPGAAVAVPLPIIAITALTSEEDRLRAVQAGMNGFHAKPVQANQLFAEIERLVPSPPADDPKQSFIQEEPAVAEEDVVTMELDMTALLKTVENDWALLGEIVDLYRMDAPRQLQRIQAGIEQDDAELVREAAHSLKGASGTFGDTPTYALAFQLEQAGRNRDLRDAGNTLDRLHQSIAALEKALCAELSKHNVQRISGSKQ